MIKKYNVNETADFGGFFMPIFFTYNKEYLRKILEKNAS